MFPDEVHTLIYPLPKDLLSHRIFLPVAAMEIGTMAFHKKLHEALTSY